MWYLIIVGLFALYVGYDAYTRKLGILKAILLVVGTFLLVPIVAPVYLSTRPLKAGEIREGGKAWNLLKGFVLAWTVLLVAISLISAGTIFSGAGAGASDAEAAGAAIGSGLIVLTLAAVWFFPMVGAMLLGFFLKNSAIIERGPTGLLSEESRVV